MLASPRLACGRALGKAGLAGCFRAGQGVGAGILIASPISTVPSLDQLQQLPTTPDSPRLRACLWCAAILVMGEVRAVACCWRAVGLGLVGTGWGGALKSGCPWSGSGGAERGSRGVPAPVVACWWRGGAGSLASRLSRCAVPGAFCGCFGGVFSSLSTIAGYLMGRLRFCAIPALSLHAVCRLQSGSLGLPCRGRVARAVLPPVR